MVRKLVSKFCGAESVIKHDFLPALAALYFPAPVHSVIDKKGKNKQSKLFTPLEENGQESYALYIIRGPISVYGV